MRRHATSTGTRATTLTDPGRRAECTSSSSSSSSSLTSLSPTRSAFPRLRSCGRASVRASRSQGRQRVRFTCPDDDRRPTRTFVQSCLCASRQICDHWWIEDLE